MRLLISNIFSISGIVVHVVNRTRLAITNGTTLGFSIIFESLGFKIIMFKKLRFYLEDISILESFLVLLRRILRTSTFSMGTLRKPLSTPPPAFFMSKPLSLTSPFSPHSPPRVFLISQLSLLVPQSLYSSSKEGLPLSSLPPPSYPVLLVIWDEWAQRTLNIRLKHSSLSLQAVKTGIFDMRWRI